MSMNILSTLVRKARSFAHRSGFEQAWFLPCWLLLGISRLAILVIPFRYLAPWLGISVGVAAWVPLVGSCGEARALCIAKIVQMASRHTPWTSNCFPQALTARLLLGLYRVPYVFFFGIDKDDDTFKAHAWISAGRVQVTGGNSFGRFTVVGCFVAPYLATAIQDLS
jgi:Transglutaminase-like superfamily